MSDEEKESPRRKILFWISVSLVLLFIVVALVKFPNWLRRPQAVSGYEEAERSWPTLGRPSGDYLTILGTLLVAVGAALYLVEWTVSRVKRGRAKKKAARPPASGPSIDPT